MLGVYTYKNYLEIRNKCIIAVVFDTGIRNLELCTIGLLNVKDTVIYIKEKKKREGCSYKSNVKKDNDKI